MNRGLDEGEAISLAETVFRDLRQFLYKDGKLENLQSGWEKVFKEERQSIIKSSVDKLLPLAKSETSKFRSAFEEAQSKLNDSKTTGIVESLRKRIGRPI